MNLGNIHVPKKSVKLLVLLLLSLLIASASATVYYSMNMQPSITITGAPVVFVQGNDGGGGITTLGTNSTWVSLALKAYPNATLTYGDALNISNTDTASHMFQLSYVSISPASGSASVSNFTSINFVVLNTTGVSQASFNFTTTGTTWTTPSSTGYLTIPASTQWAIQVATTAAAGAQAVTASLVIAVQVQ